jgi:hypothetical protein
VLLAGALLPLGGVLVSPATTLPGNPLGDVFKHAWAFWHVLEAPGLWTDHLGAPDGGVLLNVMWIPSLLMAPVAALAGPVLACNLWLLLSFLAIGAATAALAWEVTRDRADAARTTARSWWPSVAAGLVAQTSPYLLGYPLESGVHERLNVWVFPVVLLALLRVDRDGSWRWGAAGVLALTVATLGCQVYGVFAVVMVLTSAPLWLRRGALHHPRRLLAVLGGMAVSLALVWLLVRHAAEHPAALSYQPGRTALALGTSGGPADPATLPLLLDPRAAAAERAQPLGDLLIRTQYLGWAVLLPALAGATHAAARATVLPVVASGLLAAFLALGSRFLLGGTVWIDPLFTGLAWLVPTYGAIPPIWQQVAVAGPLLAVGVAAFLTRVPLSWTPLLVAVVIAERASVLPVPLVARTAPAAVSDVYRGITQDGSVAEVPRAWRGSDVARAEVFLAQTVHGRPLPLAMNVGSLPADRYPPILDGRSADWSAATRCLAAGGVRWVVVHADAFPNPDAARITLTDLRAALGEPVRSDADTALFDLGPTRPALRDAPMATGDAELPAARSGPAILPGGSARDARRNAVACPWGQGTEARAHGG